MVNVQCAPELTFIKVSPRFRELLLVLSVDELKVFLYLGLSVNGERQAWPSLSTIVKSTGVPRSSVQRAIHSLAGRGLVVVQVQRRGLAVKLHRYVVNHYFAYGRDTVDPPPHPQQVPLPFPTNDLAMAATNAQPESGPPPTDSTSALTSPQRGPGGPGSDPPSFGIESGPPGPDITPESDTTPARAITDTIFTIRTKEEEPMYKKSVASAQPKQRGQADPRVHELLGLLQETQGYPIAHYGQEGKAARRCLAMGYTKEQIIGCWREMHSFAFFQGKPLSLWTVAKSLGEYAAGRLRDSVGATRSTRAEAPTDRSVYEKPW